MSLDDSYELIHIDHVSIIQIWVGTRTTNFLDDFNSNSLVIKHNCFLDVSFRGAKPFDKFQLERVGFFSVDPDSTDENPVLNLTVSLKESKTKMASTTDF